MRTLRSLIEVADIQFGLYTKGKDHGDAKYLKASHFNNAYQPEKFKDSYIDLTGKTERFLLKNNDLILSGKGHRIFAWAYDEKFGPTIPSSLFYIIRPNPKILLNEYLSYYLNSDKIQYQLKNIGVGSQITSIPKRELEQIKITIPSIEEQQNIIAIGKLLDKNISITKELIEKKKALKSGLINKMIANQIIK